VAAVQESSHAVSAQATRSAQRATWLGILALLTLLSVGRLLLSAFSYGVPAWFDEELNPLLNLLTQHQAITQVDSRQYGVVVFLVFDLPVRMVGANLPALATYAAWVALPCVILAYILVARRFASDDAARWLLLALAWSSAVPLLYVIAQHMVDAWQLLFVSAALFLFTGTARQRTFAGVPLAFATLTKLLPGLLLVYLLVRAWRVALIGIGAIVLLLGAGQLLYGPLMGFGYPLAMASMGGDTVARWSTHFENNSIRGLIFKIADRFHLQGDTTTYTLNPAVFPALNLLAYAITAALVAYVLYAAWRGRRQNSVARRAIEFSLGLVTMLLVSPHTAQDYLVTVLPVLGVWLFLWTNRLPRRWGVGQSVLAGAAAVLIGVFVPMNVAARALPIGWLLNVTGNAHNTLFADQIGSAIGAYEFFGFPGVGLLLAWLVIVRLERQTRAP
jgi:Glycosyltransferase family 87